MVSRKSQRTEYVCGNCEATFPKWQGECYHCGTWNSLILRNINTSKTTLKQPWINESIEKAQLLSEIKFDDVKNRIVTGFVELDQILGGGIVDGSSILLFGDPGIGKSTLLLQIASYISGNNNPVLYVSGEESSNQIRSRADRLKSSQNSLYYIGSTNITTIIENIEKVEPVLVIIDSIQTMFTDEIDSPIGTVGQVRETARQIIMYCKNRKIPVFLTGHVTKDGSVAGPRVLEHMVDVVLHFEGNADNGYRIIRGVKNRFGSTNEIGIFEMMDAGIRQVENPSSFFINDYNSDLPGSVPVVTIEGTRPIIIEIQALTSYTVFPQPRRTVTGIDFNRMILLSTVLTRRTGLRLSDQDLIVNVIGGIKVTEPAADLGIALAIVSSFKDLSPIESTIVIGEIGLSGELRRVQNISKRIDEAQKMGFVKAIIPKVQSKEIQNSEIKVIGVSNLKEAIQIYFSD
ncbi:MAG: DNA repair protein RadA [SAR202 cluster bacterium]|nr:DNA repair protein RadA [Chloroflexota bacterium]MQG51699.1 DNA repair protein RadA [SAR202 cluster bacterium]|tara:strand:+ start:2497 stop:3876 length:1380 start_codon:yes stop_codon:yes gene_type:complete